MHTERHHSHTDWIDRIDFTKKIHLMCSQQMDPSLFTDISLQRKISFSTNLWCEKLKTRGEEVSKMKRRKEEFITFWKKLKCQSTWRTQSDAGAAIDTTASVDGQHAISPTGPSHLSLNSFFFLNSRIVTLNPFQVRTPDHSVVFPKPKEKWFLCCRVWLRGTFSIFHLYRLFVW